MTLRKIENHLDEDLYAGTAPSGLNYLLNRKRGFSKTIGLLGVRFGSTDNAFLSEGRTIEVPEGTAHFLEHKLFEDSKGDVSDRFAANGASCNAGTGFSTTSYNFSCTAKAIENLGLLLNFVQSPYFTPELVEKEQGIIGQEITMYNDDPDWIVFFNLMKCLYKEHPVRQNIAGSLESIREINPEVLLQCYNAYYRPGNMILMVSGNIDPEEINTIICEDAATREKDDGGLNDRMLKETDTTLQAKSMSQKMVVARPKILIGFKDHELLSDGYAVQKRDVISQMVIDILFGKSSSNYDELYDQGVIDDTFTAYYSGYNDFGFSLMGGDSEEPDQFQEHILKILDKETKRGVNPKSFDRQKNKYLGKIIRTFNSVESVAYSMMNFYFKGLSPSDVIKTIESITIEDLNLRLKSHFITDQAACSLIEPKNPGLSM